MTSPKTALPPQWVDDVDAVHTELSEIVRMMDILQSLHASRVGSVFGKDLDDMEGRIEKLTQDFYLSAFHPLKHFT
jgi:syntaxin 16